MCSSVKGYSCSRLTAAERSMPMAKCYEELRFTDDFMFGKVMEDKELCREVLECLLGHPVGELQDVRTERQIRYTSDGKPIRLDVYTKDRDTVYDAEMQNLNHRTVESLELAKRSRFYQSMMDTDFLQRGNSYRKLPEGKILFICTFDPFGEGCAKYVFESRCEENLQLALGDGTVKIFYNCTCEGENLPETMRALYEYIMMGTESTGLTKRIETAVDRARCNEKWRSEYMKELLHDDDVRTDAREEGRVEGREEGLAEGMARGITGFIRDKLEDGADREVILQKLENVYSLSREEAEQYYAAVN